MRVPYGSRSWRTLPVAAPAHEIKGGGGGGGGANRGQVKILGGKKNHFSIFVNIFGVLHPSIYAPALGVHGKSLVGAMW